MTDFSRVGGLIMCLPLFIACNGGGQAPGPGASVGLRPAAAQLSVADATSPYRDVLIDCVLAENVADACSFETLPLIGHEFANPSVDDVLARTVVSHQWMAIRLREVLRLMPGDISVMLKSVTAIVIADGIRPSNYSSGTGAIYIDPGYLWLDNAEKSTISKEADYRSNFGDDLPLVSLFRYVEGNAYAWPFFSLDGAEIRALTDIDRHFAALLFHELAHANDAFPPAEIIFFDRTMSPWTTANALRGQHPSERLASNMPLNAQLMFDLADVMYFGVQPTVSQLALTAGQVGLEFENDGANHDYGYTTGTEDLAMLVEEIMMHRHYGVDMQIAYTDAPANDGIYCDDYIVRWGVRNRVGDPLVKSRAEFVLQLLLDRPDVSAYTDSLPTPTRTTDGSTWCDIQSGQITAKNPKIEDTQTLKSIEAASRVPMRPDDLRARH